MPRPPSSNAPGARPPASAAEPAAAVRADEFAAALGACGPFEPRPAVAVAVSGGPDSLALTALLHEWVQRRRGSLLALHVDHRLRPESAEEAASLAAALADRGVAVRVLVWDEGPQVASGLQAAARAARHRLLQEACRAAGIPHLALAHHRDDQAETLLHRLDGGSGPDGLAAMPAVRETEAVRLIRPLLGIPKARLVATCAARGLSPLDDPSNADPRFARTALRQRLVRLAAQGLDARVLADTAAAAGVARAKREAAVDGVLAESVCLHPAGFARVSSRLPDAKNAVALRALARLLACVGGAAWPPAGPALDRVLAALRSGERTPPTLGGCLLRPGAEGWLVMREPACAPPLTLEPGQSALWDGRFTVALPATAGAPVRVGALGESGWRELVARMPALKASSRNASALPHPARVVLPAFRDLEGLWAVPQVGFVRRDGPAHPATAPGIASAAGEPEPPASRFTPMRPLAAVPGFAAGPNAGPRAGARDGEAGS